MFHLAQVWVQINEHNAQTGQLVLMEKLIGVR